MTTGSASEVTEWRLSGANRWLQLSLGAVSLAVAVLNVSFGERGAVAIADAAAGALGVVLIAYVLRTRVRAADSGVEIRVFRTRIIGYRDIAEVKLNRFTGYQSLQLVLTDGAILATPAPRAAGVEVMAAAVEAIEYRRLMAVRPEHDPT